MLGDVLNEVGSSLSVDETLSLPAARSRTWCRTTPSGSTCKEGRLVPQFVNGEEFRLGPGRTTGGIIPTEKVEEVRSWIENYHTLKEQLEKISEITRELLRREREQRRQRQRGKKG